MTIAQMMIVEEGLGILNETDRLRPDLQSDSPKPYILDPKP
jgi:hypothetical protein